MNIVVTTPTGHIGSRVVQLLIQAGVRPVVIARDASRLSDEVRAASDVRQGDLGDREFVIEATRGADALFWLIPTDYASTDPVGKMVEFGENAAAAIRANNIARTVLLSSEGAEYRSNDFIGALGKVEDALNATGANLIHLRPGYFFTNLFMSLDQIQAGVLTTTTPVDQPAPWNDPRDIGDIVAARLLSQEWSGQHVQSIHGPQYLSYEDVARIASEATGHHIQAIRISDEEMRQGILSAGMSEAVAEGFIGMGRIFIDNPDITFKRDYHNTTPTTFAAWCYENLRPVLNSK